MTELNILRVAIGVTDLITMLLLASTFLMTQRQIAAILQRFGKFVRESGQELNILIPVIEANQVIDMEWNRNNREQPEAVYAVSANDS